MDSLRGFAIVLVVLHHSAGMITADTGIAFAGLQWFNAATGPFRMTTLMFLSGLLLPRALEKSRSRYIVGKLTQIGWPYLIWTAVLFTVYALGAAFARSGTVTLELVLIELVAPTTYLWYLAYLLVFYAIALPLRRWPEVRAILIPTSLIASALVDDGSWHRLLFLLAFFFLGDAIAQRGELLSRLSESKPTVAVAAGVGLGTAIASGLGISVRFEPLWSIGIVAGIIALVWCARRLDGSIVSRALAHAGQSSIIFYVSHWPVLVIVYAILLRLGVDNRWVDISLMFVAAITVGYVLQWANHAVPGVRLLFVLPLPSRVHESLR